MICKSRMVTSKCVFVMSLGALGAEPMLFLLLHTAVPFGVFACDCVIGDADCHHSSYLPRQIFTFSSNSCVLS